MTGSFFCSDPTDRSWPDSLPFFQRQKTVRSGDVIAVIEFLDRIGVFAMQDFVLVAQINAEKPWIVRIDRHRDFLLHQAANRMVGRCRDGTRQPVAGRTDLERNIVCSHKRHDTVVVNNMNAMADPFSLQHFDCFTDLVWRPGAWVLARVRRQVQPRSSHFVDERRITAQVMRVFIGEVERHKGIGIFDDEVNRSCSVFK